MPARKFSGGVLRAARRAADLPGRELAERVGVSAPQVPKWESGASFPAMEKLPAIAQALGRQLDDLFPRHGEPDLLDVRCDAGLTQKEAASRCGVSHIPLLNAERGRKRLDPKYVPTLARTYGVTEASLLAAQDRTFGVLIAPPAHEAGAESLAAKLTVLLDTSCPGLSDAHITDRVNANGRHFLDADQFAALRSGERDLSEMLPTSGDELAFLDALARVLGVEPMSLRTSDAVARQVIDGVKFLAGGGAGQLALAARGAEQAGISPQMLSKLQELIDQAGQERK